jgi:IS5 family transposase
VGARVDASRWSGAARSCSAPYNVVRKGGVIDEVERAKNRNKSKVRARVEHVFAVVKRLWGYTKVRYRGLQKNATRCFVALGLANIFLARQRLMA